MDIASVKAQLTWAYNNIDPDLARDLPEPDGYTSVIGFIEQMESKKNVWKGSLAKPYGRYSEGRSDRDRGRGRGYSAQRFPTSQQNHAPYMSQPGFARPLIQGQPYQNFRPISPFARNDGYSGNGINPSASFGNNIGRPGALNPLDVNKVNQPSNYPSRPFQAQGTNSRPF